MNRPIRVSSRAIAVALSLVLGGVALFANAQTHAAGQQTTKNTSNSGGNPLPSSLPSWLETAAGSGVAGIGVQGWGPGANGPFVAYLYAPYAKTLAARLMDAMRHGRVIPGADYFASGGVSQGGASYLVLTFRDGTSINVDTAVQIPAKTSNSASDRFPAGTVYYVNSSSISASGVEKDSTQHAFCLVDTSGVIKSLRSQVASAMRTMEPENAYPPLNPSAAWLHHLPTDSAVTYAVEGNDGTHLFRQILKIQTVRTNLSQLFHALGHAEVVPPASVRSTEYGFRQWGRTHARSLSVTFQNGETVHISSGYAIVKPNQPLQTDPNLFRVTLTSTSGTSSVFVEDKSGVLRQAWSVVNSFAPMRSNEYP
jgi:hypothetical protein